MSRIVGACLSQFDNDADNFELLLANADGREIGHVVTREVAQSIARELMEQTTSDTPTDPTAAFLDCECTKVAQDETCPVGYPSLLCEICDGKGVVPYVELDGPELWEIVFGVNSDAANEITDEQYDRIAKAINDVFITPLRAALSANPTNPPALSE